MFLNSVVAVLKKPKLIIQLDKKKVLIFFFKSFIIFNFYIVNFLIDSLLIALFPASKFFNKKKKILFIGNLYANQNKDCLSPDYYGPFLSLKKEKKDFDYYFISYNFFYKIKIFIKIYLNQYNKIILSSNNPKNPIYITIRQLKIIKKIYKIELVNILWDTASKNILENNKDIYICHKNIINDFPNFKKKLGYNKNNTIFKLVPYDFSNIIKTSKDKNIDFIFIGQTSDYRDYRKKFLNFLKKKTNIFILDKNRDKFIPDKDYFDFISRSKITVNFSMSVDYHQIKARVLEAIYFETLVIEDERSPVLKYFKPDHEIVTYKTKEDIVKKVNYFLKNEKKRLQIVTNAKKKYSNKFTSKYYWSGIL